jgi:uncharacterized alpha-E superfamily protein
VLEVLSGHTAAMTGAQTDRMTRDDGWRLLSTGRHLERLGFLASALESAFETGAVFDEGGFEAVVALFDSTITFHAQYQQRHDIPALLDLLVLDRDNPRSLGWVAQTLRGRLARLEGSAPGRCPASRSRCPIPRPGPGSAVRRATATALRRPARGAAQCVAPPTSCPTTSARATSPTRPTPARASASRPLPCCCTSSTRPRTTTRRR